MCNKSARLSEAPVKLEPDTVLLTLLPTVNYVNKLVEFYAEQLICAKIQPRPSQVPSATDK